MLIAEVAFPLPIFKTFHYSVPQRMAGALARGSRVRAPFGPTKRLSGVVVSVAEFIPTFALKEIETLLDPRPLLNDELLDLALWLSQRYLAPMGEAIQAVFPQYLKTVERPRPIARAQELLEEPGPRFTLTPSQEQALLQLDAKLSTKAFEPALLFGLPASGKTEVYLRLAERTVAEGGQVLFLVPEISLTHPFVSDFKARLKVPVVTWHSRMGLADKREEWLKLSRGERQVVIGARSASLLPLPALRLAIVDEEQDDSYKQDGASPHYHAREVALERARRAGALLVLGSATPSLESYSTAEQGNWAMIELTDRVSKQQELPRVEVVSRKQLKRELLSPRLAELIADRLTKKEQVILLVNRRGFASFILCRKCGWVARCKSCNLAMVRHKAAVGDAAVKGGRDLLCHHCSRRETFKDACPACGHPGPLVQGGLGTQRITQLLSEIYPGARCLRLDSDTTAGSGHEDEAVYRSFKAGESDILVGTKLVAKGFHFPEVTLVGIVDADTPLNIPDFRSAERTFQLLYQAAGRAGRGTKEGLVVVQTAQPDHYVMTALQARDYRQFARQELEYRKDLQYPPFGHIARILFTGAKPEKVEAVAEQAAQTLRADEAFKDTELLGPSPGVYPKLKGRYRFQLLMKSESLADFRKVFDALKKLDITPAVRWSVLVDPLDMF